MAPKLETSNFPGYEPISEVHGISSAVIVPQGRRLMALSGAIGVDADGKLADSIIGELEWAFQNIEKAILAAAPNLTKEEAWSSVLQITSYHKHKFDEDSGLKIAKVAKTFLHEHRPAWTAVGVTDLMYGHIEVTVFAAVP